MCVCVCVCQHFSTQINKSWLIIGPLCIQTFGGQALLNSIDLLALLALLNIHKLLFYTLYITEHRASAGDVPAIRAVPLLWEKSKKSNQDSLKDAH